jgi:hypothetical protein
MFWDLPKRAQNQGIIRTLKSDVIFMFLLLIHNFGVNIFMNDIKIKEFDKIRSVLGPTKKDQKPGYL